MKDLKSYSPDELRVFYEKAKDEYKEYSSKGLNLDMSRGKPCNEQLDLLKDILSVPLWEESNIDNIDARNYGFLQGLPRARSFFAELLKVQPEQVFVGGNSSLSLMFGLVSNAYMKGLLHSEKPWSKLDKVKFLCPSPGYDRHFVISETFDMELIAVEMTPEGPNMDQVEELVKDPDVKGMWSIPKYSNPDGIIYSDKVINRLANLKPAAKDFLLIWDNAYLFHEFEGDFVEFPSMVKLCEDAGNKDMVVEFFSTSKITFPGSGVACFACSLDNIEYLSKMKTAQAISYDKMNQLRHVLYLKDRENVIQLMKKHAVHLKPRFDMVVSKLDLNLADLKIASYHKPTGGYFVSFYSEPGTAKRIHALMKDAGVIMTNAGATYPYGKDPNDSNLRIAPTFASIEELDMAMDVFCTCVKLATAEKLLNIV